MVTRASYRVTAWSAAPPQRVWDLLADAPSWKEWAGPTVRDAWWEREGEPAPGGVGAVRRLGVGRVGSREQILAYDPPRHLAYTWLTRVVRDYRADVHLESEAQGTRITWTGSFEPTLVGRAGVMRRFFERTVGGFARRLATYAERSNG